MLIFFVCMMFTGIPDFSLWLCRQGSTHAQDNRTSLGMFCRELTQICSQESSPQNIVVNTPSDAKPLIAAMNSWRFWIILSRKYLKTVRLKYTLGESHWMQRSQKKLALSNMSTCWLQLWLLENLSVDGSGHQHNPLARLRIQRWNPFWKKLRIILEKTGL